MGCFWYQGQPFLSIFIYHPGRIKHNWPDINIRWFDPKFFLIIWFFSSNSNGVISLLGPDIPVGIFTPQEASKGLAAFPNPAGENIYIGFNDTGNSKNSDISLEILNLSGQILFHKKFISVSTPLFVDISDFSTGMYFIKLNTGQQIITGKFIKR
ncbi:MAG: T9SS type A sorting domain-containing protein [Bacteroidales bacterium]|nr:T9SS type A sorting domain-containing protein [Bacteroidales bacterium]